MPFASFTHLYSQASLAWKPSWSVALYSHVRFPAEAAGPKVKPALNTLSTASGRYDFACTEACAHIFTPSYVRNPAPISLFAPVSERIPFGKYFLMYSVTNLTSCGVGFPPRDTGFLGPTKMSPAVASL